MSLNDYISLASNHANLVSLVVAIISIVLSIIAIYLSMYTIFLTKDTFRKNMTAQVELYVLDNIKTELLKNKSEQKHLMTLDYYCKCINFKTLNEKMVGRNHDFIKGEIERYRGTIEDDPEGFDNIFAYAKNRGVPLGVSKETWI